MSSDRNKCGLSSFLPMSCRGRAEAFAKRLQSRLRSLGIHDNNDMANETSWLGRHENHVAVAQPKHSSDTEIFCDMTDLESPESPEEEIDEPDLRTPLNKDNLILPFCEDCLNQMGKETKLPLMNGIKFTSIDSDSSGSFYDAEREADISCTMQYNGSVCDDNFELCCESLPNQYLSNTQEHSNSTDDLYISLSESNVQASSSINEIITLNSKDEDSSLIEFSECHPEESQCNNSIKGEIVDDQMRNSDTGQLLNELNSGGDEKRCFLEINENESARTSNPFNIKFEETEGDNCLNLLEDINQEEVETKIYGDSCLEDDDEEVPRVRRCSSLKTGKTPPDTPGRKKIVRFADALGLDLADVKTFVDEIPKIPNSAYDDLRDIDLSDDSTCDSFSSSVKYEKVLLQLFQQPGDQTDFLDRVRDNLVCLQNALVDDPSVFSIKGMISVRNIDFHKSVHIRYTLDSWKNFCDVPATYVENSCDGFSDTFSFLIYAHTLTVGQRLEFAVRFQTRGCQYWDNNNGINYCFQCVPTTNNTSYTQTITAIDDHWGASFY